MAPYQRIVPIPSSHLEGRDTMNLRAEISEIKNGKTIGKTSDVDSFHIKKTKIAKLTKHRQGGDKMKTKWKGDIKTEATK